MFHQLIVRFESLMKFSYVYSLSKLEAFWGHVITIFYKPYYLYITGYFSPNLFSILLFQKKRKKRGREREDKGQLTSLSKYLPHLPTPSLSPSPSCCECVFNKWFICSHIYILQRVREKYSKHKIVLESLPLFKVCS